MLSLLKTKGGYIVAFLLVSLLLFNAPLSAQEMEDPLYLEDDFEVVDEWEDWGEGWEEDDWLYEEMDGDGVWIQDDWMVEDNWLDTIYGTPEAEMTGAAVMAATFIGIWLLFMLPLYVYFALTLMVTAKKLGLKNGWFAWIPILNIILFFQCAGLSPWLLLLIFVPFVNIILSVYVYMKVAERRGFEPWIGILVILPVANLIIPGYLAWGEPPKKEA